MLSSWGNAYDRSYQVGSGDTVSVIDRCGALQSCFMTAFQNFVQVCITNGLFLFRKIAFILICSVH